MTKLKFLISEEVYVRSIGRSGNIVVSCDSSRTPVMYLVEFSYPYGRGIYSEDDLRSNKGSD